MRCKKKKKPISTCNAAVIRTWASYLYLKNDMAHNLSISKNT